MKFLVLLSALLCPMALGAVTISNVTVSDVTATSAVVNWKTDTPADSFIGFGRDGGLRADTGVLDKGGVTEHKVSLTGLEPGTSILFVIRSTAKGKSAFFDSYGKVALRTLAAPATGQPEVSLHINGPHHITQGYSQVFGIEQFQTAGNSAAVRGSTVVTTVAGLPPFTELHWPDQEFNGVAQNLPYDDKSLTAWGVANTQFLLRTNKGGITPLGKYTITVTDKFPKLPAFAESTTFDIYVDPVPTFVKGETAATPPPIPRRSTFDSYLTTYGKKWCGTASMWDGSVSFYDGERTFRQVKAYDTAAKLTRKPEQWDACIAQAHASYSKYVQGKAIQAIWNFPHGLYLAAKAGDEQAAADLHTLATSSNQAHLWAYANYAFDIGMMREDSYMLQTFLLDQALGHDRHEQIEQTVDYLLAFIERITQNEENAGVFEPFMGGLMAEALIQYYNSTSTPDPRILPAVQSLADWMYANVWNTWVQAGAFVYQVGQFKMGLQQADNAPYFMELRGLNLLVAPMYAWLYSKGAGTQYQKEGDAIWSASFDAAPGNTVGWSGKNFSQNYRWGIRYIEWRSPSGAVPASPF